MALLRFLAGIGATGYMVSASVLLSETSPLEVRGRNVALLESNWAYGWLLASYLGLILAPKTGWRSVFMGGLIPLIAVLALNWAEESKLYLKAEISKYSLKKRMTKLLSGLKTVFSRNYVKSTAMLWIHWFCIVLAYWGIFLWFPNILYERGIPLVKTLRYAFFITALQIPGYWSGAYLIEKLGRKKSLSLYMGLAGIGSIAYWFATSNTYVIVAAAVISIFNLGAWGITYAYTPELYPTDIRSIGAGWANSVGRVGGILGPFLVGLLLDITGSYAAAFLMFASLHLISAIVVISLGTETKGRKL